MKTIEIRYTVADGIVHSEDPIIPNTSSSIGDFRRYVKGLKRSGYTTILRMES